MITTTAADLGEIERRVKTIAASLNHMADEANQDAGRTYWKHVPELSGRF